MKSRASAQSRTLRQMAKAWLAACALAFPLAGAADSGPVLDTLKVVRIYTGDTTDRLYIEFNDGAMPGCHANSGGRLYNTDPFYSQVYAQILTLMTAGGMKGAVIFENQGGSNWSICRIKGLDLRP